LIISQWPKADTRWYLGVRCKKCRAPILFALDHSDGSGDGPPTAGKLVLTCALEKCRHQADYTTSAVSRFRKQPDKATEANKENAKGRNRKG
jgi:hypothetical protein